MVRCFLKCRHGDAVFCGSTFPIFIEEEFGDLRRDEIERYEKKRHSQMRGGRSDKSKNFAKERNIRDGDGKHHDGKRKPKHHR